jgi:hypothetical protein
MKVKSRKEIHKEYKERIKPAGIFQVKNTINGKVLLGSSLNLEWPSNGYRFRLTIGSHRNKVLQQEWNEHGSEKFVFGILEVLRVKDDSNFNLSEGLTLLEQIWLEKPHPFDERGYNINAHIRQV